MMPLIHLDRKRGRFVVKKISLLGATGSIGWQTYDILKEQRDAFHLVAFSSGRNMEKTREMIETLQPELVSVQLEEDALTLTKAYPNVHFTFGAKGLVEVATHPDSTILVNALLGSVLL